MDIRGFHVWQHLNQVLLLESLFYPLYPVVHGYKHRYILRDMDIIMPFKGIGYISDVMLLKTNLIGRIILPHAV